MAVSGSRVCRGMLKNRQFRTSTTIIILFSQYTSRMVYIPQSEVGRVLIKIIFFRLTRARFIRTITVCAFFHRDRCVSRDLCDCRFTKNVDTFKCMKQVTCMHLYGTVCGIIILLGPMVTFTVENTVRWVVLRKNKLVQYLNFKCLLAQIVCTKLW